MTTPRTATWDDDPVAAARQAWLTTGTEPGQVVHFVGRGISPDEVATLRLAWALTDEQIVIWHDRLHPSSLGEFTSAVSRWLRAGIPRTPPDFLGFLDHAGFDEVGRWRAAEFTYAETAELISHGLDSAEYWRAAGLTTKEIRQIYALPRTVTRSDIADYTSLGFSFVESLGWLSAGFGATDAEYQRGLGREVADADRSRWMGQQEPGSSATRTVITYDPA